MKKTIFFFMIFFSVINLAQANESPSINNKIVGLRIGEIDGLSGKIIRIVVETTKSVEAKIFLLNEPWRLVLDFQNTIWAIETLNKKRNINFHQLTKFRFGEPEIGVGRLVFEFNAPSSPIKAYKLLSKNNINRFVIDISKSSEIGFVLAQRALKKNDFQIKSEKGKSTKKFLNKVIDSNNHFQKVIPSKIKKNNFNKENTLVSKSKKKWIIAIDAGHGGKDPGAIGHSGNFEKDITLLAAKELSQALNKSNKITTVLTRDTDKYLFLRERIKFAKKKNADLFISLHADSAQSKVARGFSIFSLSEIASDKEAEKLAKRENLSDLIGDPNTHNDDLNVKSTIINMFQRESMNESTKIADMLLKEIKVLPNIKQRGHRFAGFAVLKSPDIPSLLIEMGFLSNSIEEKNLLTKSYRQNLINKIASGLIKYINSYEKN